MANKFVVSESTELISVLSQNISEANQGYQTLIKGTNQLTKALTSGELQGATYQSANNYFLNVLKPLMSRGDYIVQDAQGDLRVYQYEHGLVAHYGNIDRAKLEIDKRIKQELKESTEYFVQQLEWLPFAVIISPFAYYQSLIIANLTIDTMQKDIQKIDEMLQALDNFEMRTNELFSDSLRALQFLNQVIDALKNVKITSDGTVTGLPSNLTALMKQMYGVTLTKGDKDSKGETLDKDKKSDKLTKQQLDEFLKSGGKLMVYKDKARAKTANQMDLPSNVSFADADVTIWYLVKDGIVINLADHPEFKALYNYLQKQGSKLKTNQYTTVSYNQAQKLTVDSMDGFAGDVARVAYYFRPIEDAIAGIVAGVTTAKAVQATGKVPYGDNGLQSKELEFNGIHFSAENSPSVTAKKWQGKGKYPGIDNYQDAIIKKGSIVYRGEPNGTEYFTTTSAIEEAGGFAENLFNGLQVEKHPIFGYRNTMQGYEITSDIRGGISRTIANKQFGNGGSTQLFIPDIDDLIKSGSLKPTSSITLK